MANGFAAAAGKLRRDADRRRRAVQLSDGEQPTVNARTEHFGSPARAREAAQLGVWVFLATELVFFGPLFLGYAWGRVSYGAGFAAASQHTDLFIGTTNTAILLTSSLFMALAARAIQSGRREPAIHCLWITAALGVTFLGFKAFEYLTEWQ